MAIIDQLLYNLLHNYKVCMSLKSIYICRNEYQSLDLIIILVQVYLA